MHLASFAQSPAPGTRRPGFLGALRLLIVLACLSACHGAGTNDSSPKTIVETSGFSKDLAQARIAADRFMQALSRNDKAAYEVFRRNWYRSGEAVRMTEDLERQWKTQEAVFRLNAGEREKDACEFLGARKIGESLVRFVYILKYEFAVCPWVLTFYRPVDEWQWVGVTLGDAAQDDMASLETRTTDYPKRLRETLDKALGTLDRGGLAVAFSDLEDLWGRPEEAASVFVRFEQQLRGGQPLLEHDIGRRLPGGFELAGASSVGKSFVRFVYLEKRERGICPWGFQFYKARDTWHLIGLAMGKDVPGEVLSSHFVVEPGP